MDTNNFFHAKYTGTKAMTQHDIHSANATGFGAAADDYMERGIDLNEELIRNKPATFFMRISSDAMKDAGIYKGDVAIVDRSVKATNGKIIIAVLNGDMLIRRFEKTNRNIRLLTDSAKLSPIQIDDTCEEFSIWGVVTYIIHSC
jgi:DNA polymerase V